MSYKAEKLSYRHPLHFIIPGGTPALFVQLRVVATATAAFAVVVPDLFLVRANERNGQSHAICPPNSACPMDVVARGIGECEI